MQLYDWQELYIRNAPPRYIFSADTGTGKTIMSLALYHQYYPESNVPLLVIAPAAKVRTKEWEAEIHEFFADKILPEYQIYSYEGLSRDKRRSEKQPDGTSRKWIEPAPFVDMLRNPPIPAIIADECHKIANPQSIMGSAVYQLARSASFFVGLSATPLPNNWISAANYFKIFGFTRNITEFKRRYVHEDRSRGFPLILGYYRQDELKEYWNSISKRLKKEDVLRPNEMLEIKVPLPATREYNLIYATRVLDGTLLDNPAKYAHALRQATISGKLDWLETILDGTDENVLIFYNYVKEREAVLKLLKQLKKPTVFRIDGQVQNQPQKSAWPNISNSVTLAQYQSGSTGIELTYCSVLIFLSPTYSYAQYMQSIGRVDRIGQTKPLTMYKPHLKGTVEHAIWAALGRKEDFQELVWYNQIDT